VTVPGPGASKAEWRTWARARRSGARAAGDAITDALRPWLEPGSAVLLYDPLPDEVDVTGLTEGHRALITRTEGDALTIHGWDEPREEHERGYSQPSAGSPEVDPAEIDVAVVPGLAFDARGVRLGRGGGHYDRLLSRLRDDAAIVGVAPSAVVVTELPFEAHDVRVTHLATEDGVRSVERLGEIVDRARAWAATDPDPATQAEMGALLAEGDLEELEERMGTTLEFGTAGIRGIVGAGSNRMNRAVVIRTTAGLATHLGTGRVVVGFDARPTSRTFATDTVAVLAAAGLEVSHFTEVVPTPLVAFTALHRGARAAVVVTASHNPPRDNGYKVYDANGAQIVPPVDRLVAEAIDAAPAADAVPRDEAAWGGSAEVIDLEDAAGRYLEAVLAFRGDPPAGASPRIAYTPLHGVGGALTVRVLAAGGHGDVHPVPEQFVPDGRFPTVDFPNPEEPGALDLAERLGSEVEADVVLANDPDADRLAVAVPYEGGWRRLTGNEIGVLLADFVLDRTSGDDRLVVNSIVSSPLLGEMAAARGVGYARTLTGFKWIANAALDLEQAGARFVLGYEEALGYTVGPVVRDKDGMSAALWFADLLAVARASGESVWDRLDRLYDRHGVWVSAQHSIVLPGLEGAGQIAAAMDRLGIEVPDALAGMPVLEATDYREGAGDRPRWLPATPLVELSLEGGSRVLARPSGTEPKLKVYADLRAEPGTAAGEVRDHAERAAADLASFLGLG
jgi:phosphomannomutase